MNEKQHQEITSFLIEWTEDEGLCRFCDRGRLCGWSRRGRQVCPGYSFVREMDCFHLWIAAFDRGKYFREGYEFRDDHPWKNEPPEMDIPPYEHEDEKEKYNELMMLKTRKNNLMQEIYEIQEGIKEEKLVKELNNVIDKIMIIERTQKNE